MRTKPYTDMGIKRMKCFRCGDRAGTQWQICSDGNVYRPLCVRCDIELNDLVLKFMGIEKEKAEQMISDYIKKWFS